MVTVATTEVLRHRHQQQPAKLVTIAKMATSLLAQQEPSATQTTIRTLPRLTCAETLTTTVLQASTTPCCTKVSASGVLRDTTAPHLTMRLFCVQSGTIALEASSILLRVTILISRLEATLGTMPSLVHLEHGQEP
jgi:hypothetical protein